MRKLLAGYSREVRNRTKDINPLYALFVCQGYTTIVKKHLSAMEKRREAIEILKGQEREEAEWLLKVVRTTDKGIERQDEAGS